MACTTTSGKALPAQKNGNTWTLVFQWSQRNGTPVNLAGCQARMQIRHATTKRVLANADAMAIDVAAGLVTATFHAATTAQVPPGTHLTDMKLVFLSGEELSSPTLSLPVIEGQTE